VILQTKLYVPRFRQDTVLRRRLVDRLSINLDKALILLSAPAGYGKTTLLAQFVAEAPLPVAWYQLDASDNDPALFFEYFTECIARPFPEFGATPRSLLQGTENIAAEWQRFLVVLVNEMVETVPEDVLVVLEDYHVIDNPLIHGFVDRLLAQAPPQLHVILSTRSDPLISMARLRARRQVGEIRAEELRFTVQEVGALLEDTAHLELSPADIQTLMQGTEGWAAALQLALLSLSRSRSASVHTMIEGFGGANRYLYDYLSEDVLRGQPPEIRSFLLQSSILEQMSPDLCNAVLEIDNAREILEALDAQNLFSVPLDDRREWYRYHRLFRGFLREELQRSVSKDRIRALHSRAVAYFEAVGELDQAIAYCTAGNATGRLVELIEQTAPAWLAQGRFGTVERWLEAVPGVILASRPWLTLFRGQILVVQGQLRDARVLLEQARQAFAAAGDELGESRALAHSSRIAVFEGRYEESLDLNHQAMMCMPWTDHEGRNQALRDQAELWLYLGEAARALHAASESVAEAQHLGDQALLATSIISKGLLQVAAGQLSEGMTTLQLGLAALDSPTALGAHIAYAVLGSVHLYRWELDQAMEHFQHSLALSQRFQDSTFAVYAHISMAIVHSERKDHDQVQAHSDAALSIVENTGMRSLLGEGAWSYAAEWHVKARRYTEAEQYSRRAIAFRGEASPASAWGMGWLPLAKLYLATGRLDEAEKILLGVEVASEKGKTAIPLIDSAFHLGRLCLETGREEEAVAHLRRALGAAAPQGHRWLVLTHGREAVPVLIHALKHAIEPTFVHSLLRELGEVPSPALVESPAHPNAEAGRLAPGLLVPEPARHLETPTAAARDKVLSVTCFGEFGVKYGDQMVGEPGWLATRAGELFAYFVTFRESSVPRDRVLEALWPGAAPERGSGAFHTALYKMRQMLRTSGRPEKFVQSRSGEYRLEKELFWLDVDEFVELNAKCSRHAHESIERCETCIGRLQRAVNLYHGDYLENLYYDWALDEQRQLQETYLKVLQVLAVHHAGQGDYEAAIAHCQQALALDPLREDVHCRMMRYYGRLGDRNAIVRHFRRLEQTLADELGVDPMPETQNLYRSLVN
jgi:LuxR family maltose regulon positive regulatory protein